MRHLGAAILISAMLSMCGAPAVAQTQVSLPKIEGSYLVVEASATADAAADSVVISVRIEGTADTLDGAREAHLAVIGKIAEALKPLGVEADDIKSVGYSSRRNTRHDPATNEEVFVSFTVDSQLQITTTVLEKAPEIMEATMASGAAGVNGFTFASSKTAEARAKAIADAKSRARADAEALAVASGVVLGSTLGVYLDPWNYEGDLGIPRPISGGMVFGAVRGKFAMSAPESIVFEPQPVQASATVRLVYETKPIAQ